MGFSACHALSAKVWHRMKCKNTLKQDRDPCIWFLLRAHLSCVHLDWCCTSRLWLVFLCLNYGSDGGLVHLESSPLRIHVRPSAGLGSGSDGWECHDVMSDTSCIQTAGSVRPLISCWSSSSVDVMMCVCVFTLVFLSLISSRCLLRSVQLSAAVLTETKAHSSVELCMKQRRWWLFRG